jgi:hypothetical protein
MAAAKHFAPKRDVKPAPIVEFSVAFVRDGVEEIHEFQARPRTTYGDMLGLVKHQDDEKGRALLYLDRMISRMLLDSDGTPAKFKPNLHDGHFSDPDGNHTPEDDLPKFLAFEAGSSRRRWIHLMQFDDEVEVDFSQINDVFEHLTSEAAARPT